MPDKPYIIGITGGSGSGKTSFIRKLRDQFGVDQLCIVSQDNYYKSREQQVYDPNGVQNFDLPTAIDQVSFLQDVERLIEGQTVEIVEYTYNNSLKEPDLIKFHPAPVMILEGLFVFEISGLRDLLDLKVFIHAKDNLKIIRRILRDRIERNYPIDDVLYRYQHHVLPTYEQHIKPYREKADLVINNNDNFETGLDVLCGFIRSILSSRGSDEK